MGDGRGEGAEHVVAYLVAEQEAPAVGCQWFEGEAKSVTLALEYMKIQMQTAIQHQGQRQVAPKDQRNPP